MFTQRFLEEKKMNWRNSRIPVNFRSLILQSRVWPWLTYCILSIELYGGEYKYFCKTKAKLNYDICFGWKNIIFSDTDLHTDAGKN